jgi:hypothetical protein
LGKIVKIRALKYEIGGYKIMDFENSYPYSQDVKLLKELKLAAWSAKHGEEKKIGIVVCKESTVEIFVTCLPAQFYKFIIKVGLKNYDTDIVSHQIYEMTTGSGSLSDYWPMAKAIAENMVVIKEVL